MAEFFYFNLWMFFVIGLLGAAFCYLRFKFVWWVTPVAILISISYILNLGTSVADIDFARRPNLLLLTISIAFAIVFPMIGAFVGRQQDTQTLSKR